MNYPLQFPPLLDAYITTETLAGNAKFDKTCFLINLDNIIISKKEIRVYPHKIALRFSPKFAPYAWKTLAKYKMSHHRVGIDDLEIQIRESEENMYNILTNLNTILEEVGKKYSMANRDVEQCHRN